MWIRKESDPTFPGIVPMVLADLLPYHSTLVSQLAQAGTSMDTKREDRGYGDVPQSPQDLQLAAPSPQVVPNDNSIQSFASSICAWKH